MYLLVKPCVSFRSIGKAYQGGNERDTEKPKRPGYCANRRLRIVDLPEPLGPDITIGLLMSVAFPCLANCDILSEPLEIGIPAAVMVDDGRLNEVYNKNKPRKKLGSKSLGFVTHLVIICRAIFVVL